ncbi:MAG: hypothetical protein AMJ77_04870 [Dehalococcoidia bacterium SM23_28_2]|nr:MAG: hypothetical protein AMJ77_04870 [Dehalococcoidia bacterium SM23_28_2]
MTASPPLHRDNPWPTTARPLQLLCPHARSSRTSTTRRRFRRSAMPSTCVPLALDPKKRYSSGRQPSGTRRS